VVSAALPPGKSPRYPFYRRLGGPQSRSGRCGEMKIFYPIGTQTPAPPGRPARSQSLYWLSYNVLYYLMLLWLYGKEPGYCSLYSDWLQTGRPRDQSSRPGRVKNFHFSMSFRLALGPTQPPIQWVLGGSFPGGNAAGVWSWPLTSNSFWGVQQWDL
jgi:hypothetical protein